MFPIENKKVDDKIKRVNKQPLLHYNNINNIRIKAIQDLEQTE